VENNMPLSHRLTTSSVLIVVLAASAMGGGVALAAETAKPAKLEPIPGSDMTRVVLTPKAAERLAIRTDKIREEPVRRWLTVDGEVEAGGGEQPVRMAATSTGGPTTETDAMPVRVRVPLLDSDHHGWNIGQAIPVLSLGKAIKVKHADDDDDDDDDDDEDEDGKQKVKDDDDDDDNHKGASKPPDEAPVRTPAPQARADEPDVQKATPIKAGKTPIAMVISVGDSGRHRFKARLVQVAMGPDGTGAAEARYYVVDRKQHTLRPGQRVYVRVPQPGSGALEKVIPYAAIIYDPQGNTWAYTNPEPLTYVKQPIEIEYIQGGLAILKKGPETGTAIVTVGAPELLGIEQKIGH
jgi:hypothetical protein